MRSSRVVVLEIFFHDLLEVFLVEDEDVVCAFIAHRSDPTLSVSIRVWILERSSDDLGCQRIGTRYQMTWRIFLSLVPNQKFHCLSLIFKLPEHLSGLLGDPSAIGIGCAASKIDTSRAVFDKDEDKKGLQEQCFNRKEVTGNDLIAVMCHQCRQLGDGSRIGAGDT